MTGRTNDHWHTTRVYTTGARTRTSPQCESWRCNGERSTESATECVSTATRSSSCPSYFRWWATLTPMSMKDSKLSEPQTPSTTTEIFGESQGTLTSQNSARSGGSISCEIDFAVLDPLQPAIWKLSDESVNKHSTEFVLLSGSPRRCFRVRKGSSSGTSTATSPFRIQHQIPKDAQFGAQDTSSKRPVRRRDPERQGCLCSLHLCRTPVRVCGSST